MEVTESRDSHVGTFRVRRALPAPRAAHGRSLVLRRPHGSRPDHRRPRARCRPASAHRPADGHLAARGRGAAPRFPRHRAGDLARPAQPDDRRPRRRRTPRRAPVATAANLHGVQLWVAQPSTTRHGAAGVRAPRRAAPVRSRRSRGDRAGRRARRRRFARTSRHRPRRRRPRPATGRHHGPACGPTSSTRSSCSPARSSIDGHRVDARASRLPRRRPGRGRCCPCASRRGRC